MTEKLYRDNPYLRELTARVIEKKYQKGAFHLVLNRTLFYPHLSGGQPRDKGTINDIEVVDVYERDNKIVHVIENDIIGNDVILSIHWDTRFTHMQQHTGQHILSTVFSKLYNAKTVGFHLGSEFVYIDVTMSCLENSDLERIENFANKVVFSNFNVKTYYPSPQEISTLPLRKEPSVEGNIRIVEIDGIDYTPCGGTHVRNTGEVGIIKIRKWEKYKGNIRIEFVCGNRALQDFRRKNEHINSISSLLSAKDTNCLNAVQRMYDENKDLQKEIRLLRNKLMEHEVDDLYRNSKNYKDIKIVSKVFNNKNFKDIRQMTNQITEYPNSVVVMGVIENNKCQIIIGRSQNLNINTKEIFDNVIGIINGQGGGSSKISQGGGPRVENLESCIDTSLEMIKKELSEA